MSLSPIAAGLRAANQVSQARADEIVAAARPMALVALGRPHESPTTLDVAARQVEPTYARGGSLVPAWPHRTSTGGVSIEFVSDWCVMLSAWRSLFEPGEVDDLLASGQRTWIGIANDVLQLFVPDPPPGTYSMVRHHALMLVAATLWLGPEGTRRWQAAHTLAASRFLRRIDKRQLWTAIEEAESGLNDLLQMPECHRPADAVLEWLDRDADALDAYRNYLGAASLGVAALLESIPTWTPRSLTHAVCHQHHDPHFNRKPIEHFALVARA